jgi:hypothetical protein
LQGKPKKALTLLPEKPRHPERYKCEGYREAWGLLLPGEERSRADGSVAARGKSKPPPCLSKNRRDKDGAASG